MFGHAYNGKADGMNGWTVFLVIAVPILGIGIYFLLEASIVHIEPGQLGLLLVHGKATDTALLPGRHWVPALRRRMTTVYPSRELSFRATSSVHVTLDPELERVGPTTPIVLGDGAEGDADYTIRFRLDQSMLASVHDRFGPEGIWAAVRDLGARSVAAALNDATSVDDVYGPGRQALNQRVADQVTADLATDGFIVTVVDLAAIDLGASGFAIQAAVRARLELAREQAETTMRRTRAEGDAEIARLLADVNASPALRYRETDAWRDVQVEMVRSQRLMATHQSGVAQVAVQQVSRPSESQLAADEQGDDE